MSAFNPHHFQSDEILISPGKKTLCIIASCPGKRIPIRSSASTNGDIIGYISSGDALLVNKKTTAGFYQLADQMGFFNKSTRDVEWIQQQPSDLPAVSVEYPIPCNGRIAVTTFTSTNNTDFDSFDTTGNVSKQSDPALLLSKIDELAKILKKHEKEMKILYDQQMETACKLDRVEADNKLHITKIKVLEKEIQLMKVEKISASLPTLSIPPSPQYLPNSNSNPSTADIITSSTTPLSSCSPPFPMLLSPFQANHYNYDNHQDQSGKYLEEGDF